MKVVDVHNHLYPIDYLNYLQGRTDSPIKVERTGPTLDNLVVHPAPPVTTDAIREMHLPLPPMQVKVLPVIVNRS